MDDNMRQFLHDLSDQNRVEVDPTSSLAKLNRYAGGGYDRIAEDRPSLRYRQESSLDDVLSKMAKESEARAKAERNAEISRQIQKEYAKLREMEEIGLRQAERDCQGIGVHYGFSND